MARVAEEDGQTGGAEEDGQTGGAEEDGPTDICLGIVLERREYR
jgi:hypothetical protein